MYREYITTCFCIANGNSCLEFYLKLRGVKSDEATKNRCY